MSTTILQQSMQRYADLTAQLTELVSDVAQAEENLTQCKLILADEKAQLEFIGDAVVDGAIQRAGGVKEFGSSEDVRKANAKRAKAMSANYVQQERQVAACEIDVARAEDLLKDLTRRYGATCYHITHHAAFMQHAAAMLYLAGPQVQIPEFTLPVAVPNGFNGSTVSVADAENAGF